MRGSESFRYPYCTVQTLLNWDSQRRMRLNRKRQTWGVPELRQSELLHFYQLSEMPKESAKISIIVYTVKKGSDFPNSPNSTWQGIIWKIANLFLQCIVQKVCTPVHTVLARHVNTICRTLKHLYVYTCIYLNNMEVFSSPSFGLLLVGTNLLEKFPSVRK